MPTYSYQCDACGCEFDKEQRISEAPIKKCPKCGKLKARRMISSGNFILKGGGWYSDHYGLKSSSGGGSSSDSSGGSDD
jgi:putative FmdB family regulatory protein